MPEDDALALAPVGVLTNPTGADCLAGADFEKLAFQGVRHNVFSLYFRAISESACLNLTFPAWAVGLGEYTTAGWFSKKCRGLPEAKL
jgi:hypothetical protein